MNRRFLSAGVLAGLFAAVPLAHGAVIVQYNFGSSQSNTETVAMLEQPTTSAPNIVPANLTPGGTTNTVADPAVSGYYSAPGGNYLSVNNSSVTTSDSGFYVDFVVTAASGYEFTPTSFSLVGGAGGGTSNARSVYVFDNLDGFPTSINATGSNDPTPAGGDDLVSGTFSAVRGSSPLVAMNTFTATDFTAQDQNLTSFEMRAYFDTQVNDQAKNIDLGSLTLNGTVSAVPEPTALCGLGVAAIALAFRPRRRLARG